MRHDLPTSSFPLYDASFEHDACGVGLLARISGEASHDIVRDALSAVACLAHRGAVDADEQTGDGAGILTALPQAYFRRLWTELSGTPFDAHQIAVATFFLSRDAGSALGASRRLIRQVLEKRGFTRLLWREVPINASILGVTGASSMPVTEQLLIACDEALSPRELDRKLYAARKEIESRAAAAKLSDLYVVSLSCRTIVYKGLLSSHALGDFYADLRDPAFVSCFAIFHQRYSTNTFPTWSLAHPFRMLAHNGEINTISGNRIWSRARAAEFGDAPWGLDTPFIREMLLEGGSDSAHLDNAFELLTLSGRSPLLAMAMLVPEAYAANPDLDPDLKAFGDFHLCMNEPWDGPSAVVFSDGEVAAATLDRNGLRPARYLVTRDGRLLLASEVGVLAIDDSEILERGRLGPGQMIAVDFTTGRLLHNTELKQELAAAEPYREWVADNLISLDELPPAPDPNLLAATPDELRARQQAAGYSSEELKFILTPMGEGQEPVGSMGDDTPIAVLSRQARPLSAYFKQRFAQVTNPPIDSIREASVMSLAVTMGRRHSWLEASPAHARQYRAAGPVISDAGLRALRTLCGPTRMRTFSTLFEARQGQAGLRQRLRDLADEVERFTDQGGELIVLSDRGASATHAALPILLAVGAVNSHLLRAGKRLRCSILAETAEPRDVHHFATLVGFGASAINPYLAFESLLDLHKAGEFGDRSSSQVLENFRQTIYKGLLKIIAKMGISVMGSYRGAQIFEAVGVADEVIADCFPGTPSRIGGIGYAELTRDLLSRHEAAFGATVAASLEDHGQYRYRKQAETHAWSPDALRALQKFRKTGSAEDYADYAKAATDRPAVALRDLLSFRQVRPPVQLDEVESGADIRRRFTTAAMSLGALSPETHETLAVAMNRIGGKSNSGEGGEDAARFVPNAKGDLANSAIKQIASARFGVTPAYLMSARELEIKMAQGSKPGEGGQLPGHKVSPFIAHLRKAVPGVTLISPPPHHDIYSIEDLAQLIYDLKEVNPAAHICVKLVAEAGVGTIAAGVVKAFADVILVSGDVGGTGASPWSSIKSAGSPWELGLAEVQQVLLLNGLRERVRLRTDGGLRTGRDIVVAAMLGAEEYNFGTAALIALGCKYVRQCHLNTCPVGIATQREDLRLKYDGTPEQIVAFFDAVSEEVRTIIAELGFRSLGEVVGRADLLEQVAHPDHPKANLLRLDALLARPDERNSLRYNTFPRNGVVPRSLNDTIAEAAEEAIRNRTPIELHFPIQNTDRTIGARLAGRIALSHGDAGLPDNTITLQLTGQAGQSFGAFCLPGVSLRLRGEANDYVGKSMCGGLITITPGEGHERESEQVVAGNTCLYGATGGSLFIRGSAGERFCVRNSGATAVVEGVGEHGCEYMTGGVAVILGETGRNFGAGMTGGVAFVYDEAAQFERRCNRELIQLSRLESEADEAQLRALLEAHVGYTGSLRAKTLLADWPAARAAFWKVAPRTA